LINKEKNHQNNENQKKGQRTGFFIRAISAFESGGMLDFGDRYPLLGFGFQFDDDVLTTGAGTLICLSFHLLFFLSPFLATMRYDFGVYGFSGGWMDGFSSGGFFWSGVGFSFWTILSVLSLGFSGCYEQTWFLLITCRLWSR